MKVNPENPYTLGMYRVKEVSKDENNHPIYSKPVEGHSLAPFAVEDKGDGTYWVDVYDSNYPRETHHVEFNTKEETWKYQPGDSKTLFEGDAYTKNLDLTRLSRRDLKSDEYFTCPFCDHANSSTDTDPVDISLIGQGNLSITDSEGGEIDGVEAQPFKGGLNKDVPPTYHIPSSKLKTPFKITLTGTNKDKNSTINMTGPNFHLSFQDINLGEGQKKLEMYIYPANNGPKLSFKASVDTKVPTLNFALTDKSTETDYEFKISNVNLYEGRLMQVEADTERNRLYYGDNDGNQDEYELSVKATTNLRDNPFTFTGKRTLGDKKLEYLAYGVWRANLLSPKHKDDKFENLPFITVPFKALNGSNGEIFDTNTINNNSTRPVRNSNGGRR